MAGEAALAARGPWSYTYFNPTRTIGGDGTVRDVSKQPLVASALAQLSVYRKLIGGADGGALGSSSGGGGGTGGASSSGGGGAQGGSSALEVMADMLSPPTLALIGAAAAPDLVHNVTLGLNRSAASGARMRTAAPIAAAHATDVAAVAAGIALATRRAGEAGSPAGGGGGVGVGSGGSSGAAGSGLALPAAYVGSVPAALAAALEDAQSRMHEGEGDNWRVSAAVACGATYAERCTRCLDAFIVPGSKARVNALAAEVLAAPPALAAATPLSSAVLLAAATAAGTGPAGSSRLSVGPPVALAPSRDVDGVVVSSSSDPLHVTLAHTPLPGTSRLTLHLRFSNVTRLRLPAGTRVTLALGGPLQFDRAGVTAAMVASSSSRLGGSAAATAAAAGGAAAGGLGSGSGSSGGDTVAMQRSSTLCATFTLLRPLPPGYIAAVDVDVAVAGFGSATVRALFTFETVEVPPGADGEPPADTPAAVLAAARVSRAVGVTAAEDAADDDDVDADWSRAGTAAGGVGGAWGTDLCPPCASSAGDGLLWCGPELSAARRGRLLGGVATAGLSITRTTANRAPGATGAAPAGAATPAGRAAGAGGGADTSVMREWSARDAGIVSSPSVRRRLSGVSGALGAATMALSERDDGESAAPGGGGGGGDDDAGSTASGGTGAGGGGGGGGGGDADFDAAAGGVVANGAKRPFVVRRLELSTAVYRLPAWSTLLVPLQVRLPPALALALACGVDVLPGAASAFGIAGAPSQLAAAALDGGGVATAALASGAAVAATSGSVVSIAHAPFACTMARLPYAHYAVCQSQPFAGGAGPSIMGGGGGMASPAWLAAVLAEGLGPGWTRVPAPLAPALPPVAASRGIYDAAQAAFTACTWGGATVALFATALRVAVVEEAGVKGATAAGGGGGARCAWQVSLQLRTDDARVRSTFASDMAEFCHAASCGRLALVAHGHAPMSQSLLQQVDVFMAHALTASDAAASTAGSTSASATAAAAAAAAAATTTAALGIGLLPVAAATAGREGASAGDGGVVTGVANVLGTSIFAVVPEDLLAALIDAASGPGLGAAMQASVAGGLLAHGAGTPTDGAAVRILAAGRSPPPAAHAPAVAELGAGGAAAMPLGEFFAVGSSAGAAAAAGVPAMVGGTAGIVPALRPGTSPRTTAPAAAGYDPFA